MVGVEVGERQHGGEGSVGLTKVGEGEKSGMALAENRGEDLVDVVGCVKLVEGGRHGGWWACRVWWVDGQKLWFQGERLGSGGVVDVARVRRTNRGQGLRLERKRCEQEGVGWRRWNPWMQQCS